MAILAVLQARMSSTRLPGKVMRPILGQPMLARQLERLSRSRRIDRLVVATSNQASDDPLAEFCRMQGQDVFRGSLDDVLGRFHAAMAERPRDHVVRLTGDCPLADPEVIDACIDLHLLSGADYTSNALERTYPKGLDVEVATRAALETAWAEAADPYEREHVTPFLYRRPARFRLAHLIQSAQESDWRWTVDTPEDFAFVTRVYDTLYPRNPAFTSADIRALDRPEGAGVGSIG